MNKKLSAIYANMREKLAFLFFAALLLAPSISLVGWAKDFRTINSGGVGTVESFKTRTIADADVNTGNKFNQYSVNNAMKILQLQKGSF